MTYIVKRHLWQNGGLKTFENEFKIHHEALAFAKSIKGEGSVKLYNSSGELMHSVTLSENTDTYA